MERRSFSCNDELWNALSKAAAERGVSVSRLLRSAAYEAIPGLEHFREQDLEGDKLRRVSPLLATSAALIVMLLAWAIGISLLLP